MRPDADVAPVVQELDVSQNKLTIDQFEVPLSGYIKQFATGFTISFFSKLHETKHSSWHAGAIHSIRQVSPHSCRGCRTDTRQHRLALRRLRTAVHQSVKHGNDSGCSA